MMGSQPIQALLGFGVATESGLANSGAAIIYELLGYQEATYRDDGVGHNNYIGSLFVGGAVAGSVLIAYKFFVFCLCWKCVRNFSRAPGPSTYLSVSAPLSVIAYLAFGFLGGYFGSRSASVCLAIAIGLTIWQMANSASRPIRNTLPRRTLAS